jgi:KDO2-lipid IV(A) lauroyltransferase
MRRLGYRLGWLASFVGRRRLRMAERHQKRVQGDGVDVRAAARRVFGHYGRYWAETFWMTPRRRRSVLARTSVENLEILHRAVASERGIVLALPHVGNWEAAGLRAAAEGARVLAVAEALPNERIVGWFTRMREMMDIDIVIARKGMRVTRDLMARLDAGGTVALLCDRDLKGTGVPVTLFGERTTLPAGPIALADRTGADLIPVGTYFKRGAGHHFILHPPLQIPDVPRTEERIRLGAERLAGVLEEIIRREPEQWHLLLPNWPSDREAGG